MPKIFKEVKSIKGIVIAHNKLIIAVKEIDKATSPFANDVKILDVAPPGAVAMIITPIANSGDKGHIKSKIIATIGKIIICDINPTKKSLGFLIMFIKSSNVKDNPKANIIKANDKGKKISTIIPII
tara:strand:+ start:196 stop:576 length:381 start_codon:yes stop_codon:yes gene_type:complete